MPDSQRYSWNPYLINNVEGIVIFSMFKCFKLTTKCFPAVEMRKSPSKRNHNLKNQFLKSWTLISYWYLILDTWYLILDTWYLILSSTPSSIWECREYLISSCEVCYRSDAASVFLSSHSILNDSYHTVVIPK